MSTNHRFTLLVLSLALLAASFLASPPSLEALPRESCDCVCYDANWNIIGTRLVTCSGQIYQEGQNTGCAYRSCYCEPC